MVQIYELLDGSRTLEEADNLIDGATGRLRYRVYDTVSEDEAIDLLKSTSPAEYGGFPRRRVTLEENGSDTEWIGTATYESRPTFGVQFDTTGGRHRVFTSMLQTTYAPGAEVAPDFKGAIALDNDGRPQGVEITIPSFSWSETHELDVALLTDSYRQDLTTLTGQTNDDLFRGYESGEVLFMGAVGGYEETDETARIQFNFRGEKNEEDIAVGDITVSFKGGHDFIWVMYQEEVDSTASPKRKISVPKVAVVEEVYDFGDFSKLLIPIA